MDIFTDQYIKNIIDDVKTRILKMVYDPTNVIFDLPNILFVEEMKWPGRP